MSAVTKKLLFGVAFLLPILIAAAAPRYTESSRSTRTTVLVHVVWLPTIKAVNQLCSTMMGRPPNYPGTVLGCYSPESKTIYAVEPRDFNDAFYLEILGHEFWHALGAEHPE